MKFDIREYFQKNKVKFVNQQNRPITSSTSYTSSFPEFIQTQKYRTVLQGYCKQSNNFRDPRSSFSVTSRKMDPMKITKTSDVDVYPTRPLITNFTRRKVKRAIQKLSKSSGKILKALPESVTRTDRLLAHI